MNIVWIVGDDFTPGVGVAPAVEKMKEVGPIWGTPTSWRKCNNDNVVCTDADESSRLIKRAFHAVCNFHVPVSHFAGLGRPKGVKLFEGEIPKQFSKHSLATVFHLVAPLADVVLVIGVPFETTEPKSNDALFQAAVKKVITHYDKVQWVILDHFSTVSDEITSCPNVWLESSANLSTLFG